MTQQPATRTATRYPARRAIAWPLALSALFVAACGGSVNDGTPAPAPAAAPLSISVQVLNSSGAVLTSANVSVAVGTSAGSRALTQASAGAAYSASIPISELLSESKAAVPIVVTITRAGYIGRTLTIPASEIVAGATVTINDVRLEAESASVLAPIEGTVLTRLGNGKTKDGDLQSGVIFGDGRSRSIQLGSFAGLNLATYPTLTLSMSFRGVDAARLGCADQVAIYQTGDAAGARVTGRADLATYTSTSTPALPDSAATGGAVNTATFNNLPTAGLSSANGPLWVEVKAGPCTSSGGDIDDFEFFDVRAQFNPGS